MDTKKYYKLQALLSDRKDSKLSVEYIHGYLTAILCAPDIIVPSTWIPLILGEDQDKVSFETNEEAQACLGLLMEIYNDVAASTMDKEFSPLYSLKIVETAPDIASPWCKGFMLGLNLWSDEYLDDEKKRELLLPILVLADTKLILDSINEKDIGKDFSEEDMKELREESLLSIPANVLRLRQLHLPNITNTYGEVGRNDPCPCGSGIKYKKCCGK
jgi:uncharacterized protein